jgi:hypothetical protein
MQSGLFSNTVLQRNPRWMNWKSCSRLSCEDGYSKIQ